MKRWTLLIPVVGAISVGIFKECRNAFILIPWAIVSSFVIFFNFPSLARMAHRKPTYLEDLVDKNALTDTDRTRFQLWWTRMIIVLVSLFLGALADYLLVSFHDRRLTWFGMLGVVGGAASAFAAFHRWMGMLLMHYFMWKKKKESGLENIVIRPARDTELSRHDLLEREPVEMSREGPQEGTVPYGVVVGLS
jgi:hypothetical protein